MKTRIFLRSLLDKKIALNRDAEIRDDTIVISDVSQYAEYSTLHNVLTNNITKLVISDSEFPQTLNGMNSFLWFHNIESLDIQSLEIQSIPNEYFKRCINLHYVHLHEEITEIGYNAFDEADIYEINLENVQTIQLYAFRCNYNLKTVNLMKITNINPDAFCSTGLKEIEFNDLLTSIPVECFMACANLTTVKLGSSITVIADRAFYQCYNLKNINLENIKSFGESSFALTAIEEISFNENTETIDIKAFYRTKLAKIHFPDTMGFEFFMNDFAFSQNYFLKRIKLPTKAIHVTLGEGVFEGCWNLEEAIFGEKLTFNLDFKPNLFRYCSKLKKIVVPCMSQLQCNFSFMCTELEEVHAPECLVIGNYSFAHCQKLRILNITKCVEIRAYALLNCVNLVLKSFPDEMTIKRYAMVNCLKITELTFQVSDTYDQVCFYGLLNLKKVNITGGDSIPDDLFYGCPKLEEVILAPEINLLRSFCFYGTNIKKFDLSGFEIQNGVFAYSGLEEVSIVGCLQISPYDAFENCFNLKKIIIGNDFDMFLAGMFKNCRKLETIEFEEGSNYIVENGCVYNTDKTIFYFLIPTNKVENYVVPDHVQAIESFGFVSHPYLKTITFHHPVTLGQELFSECRKLEVFNYEPKGYIQITFKMFQNCINLKEIKTNANIIAIEDYGLENCPKLKYLNNTNYLRLVGSNAMNRSISLKYINLSNVVDFGDFCFYDCNSLSIDVYFNRRINWIGEYAFHNTSIKSIHMYGEGDASVANYAFSFCEKLTNVYIDGTFQKFEANLFYNAPVSYIYFGQRFDRFDQQSFQYLSAKSIKIEISPNNSRYYVFNNTIVAEKGTNKIVMFFSLESNDPVVIPENFSVLDCPIYTQADYNPESKIVTNFGPQMLIIKPGVLSISADFNAYSPYIFTICSEGDTFISEDISSNRNLMFFVKDDYPYDLMFNSYANHGMCQQWYPPEFSSILGQASHTAGNVFGFSKREIFIIVAISLASAAFLALLIYFIIRAKKMCDRRRESRIDKDSSRHDEIFVDP